LTVAIFRKRPFDCRCVNEPLPDENIQPVLSEQGWYDKIRSCVFPHESCRYVPSRASIPPDKTPDLALRRPKTAVRFGLTVLKKINNCINARRMPL